jgi:hypothetical protein
MSPPSHFPWTISVPKGFGGDAGGGTAIARGGHSPAANREIFAAGAETPDQQFREHSDARVLGASVVE